MKTIKTMAIISIVWLSLLFFLILDEDGSYLEMYETTVGCTLFMFLYSISFSIVVLVKSSKSENLLSAKDYTKNTDYNSDLLKLNDLKEKGIITEQQFEEKREQILYLLSSELRNFSKSN